MCAYFSSDILMTGESRHKEKSPVSISPTDSLFRLSESQKRKKNCIINKNKYTFSDTHAHTPVSYLWAAGCRPLPRCDGARWSGCPSALCLSSRTETGSSTAGCGSDSPSCGSRRCCKPPAGRTGREKKRRRPSSSHLSSKDDLMRRSRGEAFYVGLVSNELNLHTNMDCFARYRQILCCLTFVTIISLWTAAKAFCPIHFFFKASCVSGDFSLKISLLS